MLRRQKEFEEEAMKKAKARVAKAQANLKKQLDDAKKQKELADNAAKLAEDQKRAAENARKLADKERELADAEKRFLEDQLKSKQEESLEDLVRRLTKQRNRLDDTDSDSDGEPSSKRSRPDHDKCEFNSEGLKTIPADYTGMNINGLVLFNQVRPTIRKSIAKGEFFELNKMYTGTELTSTRVGNMTFTQETKDVPKQITQKSEMFFLLYQFGQFYLQIYPEKTVSFLEYLSFLTKMCDKMTHSALLELDSALRKEYVSHPQWNWDQTNGIIDRLYNYYARDPKNYKLGTFAGTSTNPLPSVQQKGQGQSKGKKSGKQFNKFMPQQQFQAPQSVFIPNNAPPMQYAVQPFIPPPPPSNVNPRPQFTPGFNQQTPRPKGQGQGQGNFNQQANIQRILQNNPNIRNERCTGWNFSAKGCQRKGCLRLHACFYCGDPGHKGPHCRRHGAF